MNEAIQLPSTPAAFVEECKARGLSPEESWLALQEARRLLGTVGASGFRDGWNQGDGRDTDAVQSKEPDKLGMWPHETIVARQQAMAQAFMASDWSHAGRPSLRNALIGALLGKPGQSITTDDKKAFFIAEKAANARNFTAILGDDTDADNVLEFLTSADLYARTAPATVSWAQVQESAEHYAWSMPGEPTAEHSSATDAQVADRLTSFSQRFGFGAVRLAGFHTTAQAALALDRFEEGCALLAETTGLAEKEIGLRGLNVAIGSPFLTWGSAFVQGDQKFLCVSPQAGWSAWAHEWLHALDAHLGTQLMATANLGDAPAFLSETDSADIAMASAPISAAVERLHATIASGQFVEENAASAPAAAPSLAAELYAEIDGPVTQSGLPLSFVKAALSRVEKGIFDRFLEPRVPERDRAQAREDFLAHFEAFFSGVAGAKPIVAWQKELLGEQSQHYAQIAIAEKDLAIAQFKAIEAKSSPKESAFSRFAAMADEKIGFEYSTYPAELWARSFESSINARAPEHLRAFFTLGGAQAGGYYPRAKEQENMGKAWASMFSALKANQQALGVEFATEPDFSASSDKKTAFSLGLISKRRAEQKRALNGGASNEPSALPRAAV